MKTSKSNTVYRPGDRRTTLYLPWTKLPNIGKEHFYRTYHRTLLRNSTFDSILESLISFKIKKISESMIVSLNENLLPGPRRQLDIILLVINFHMHPYTIVGDISRMFHQINLDEKYRDLYRYLWHDDATKNLESLGSNG